MTTHGISSQAESARESARQDNGRFGSHAPGESEATLTAEPAGDSWAQQNADHAASWAADAADRRGWSQHQQKRAENALASVMDHIDESATNIAESTGDDPEELRASLIGHQMPGVEEHAADIVDENPKKSGGYSVHQIGAEALRRSGSMSWDDYYDQHCADADTYHHFAAGGHKRGLDEAAQRALSAEDVRPHHDHSERSIRGTHVRYELDRVGRSVSEDLGASRAAADYGEELDRAAHPSTHQDTTAPVASVTRGALGSKLSDRQLARVTETSDYQAMEAYSAEHISSGIDETGEYTGEVTGLDVALARSDWNEVAQRSSADGIIRDTPHPLQKTARGVLTPDQRAAHDAVAAAAKSGNREARQRADDWEHYAVPMIDDRE